MRGFGDMVIFVKFRAIPFAPPNTIQCNNVGTPSTHDHSPHPLSNVEG